MWVLLIDILFVRVRVVICMPVSYVALHTYIRTYVSGTPKPQKSPWPLGVGYVRTYVCVWYSQATEEPLASWSGLCTYVRMRLVLPSHRRAPGFLEWAMYVRTYVSGTPKPQKSPWPLGVGYVHTYVCVWYSQATEEPLASWRGLCTYVRMRLVLPSHRRAPGLLAWAMYVCTYVSGTPKPQKSPWPLGVGYVRMYVCVWYSQATEEPLASWSGLCTYVRMRLVLPSHRRAPGLLEWAMYVRTYASGTPKPQKSPWPLGVGYVRTYVCVWYSQATEEPLASWSGLCTYVRMRLVLPSHRRAPGLLEWAMYVRTYVSGTPKPHKSPWPLGVGYVHMYLYVCFPIMGYSSYLRIL